MGRFLSESRASLSPDTVWALSADGKPVGAGYIGLFGAGRWTVFVEPGEYEWTVPTGVTQIRARVVGGGGGGCGGNTTLEYTGTGGAGGGYAHGVFTVTPGQTLIITVAAGGIGGRENTNTLPRAGGTSSVGALISATGGNPGVWITGSETPPTGGIGVGGDVQATGGGVAQGAGGGGGAGSQLGDGGMARGSGGGGVVHGSYAQAGGSAYGPGTTHPGPNVLGDALSSATDNPLSQPLRFPFEAFTGRGGGGGTEQAHRDGQSGGGGIRGGGNGGHGGGGGAGNPSPAGVGGIGGGGGGNIKPDKYAKGGAGGPGLVVLEY
ncbi:glycine-rich domain-containing protein [Roseospira marina]|uniref:glycine-rich domain-containing protein n=1 Tax=Roseospira marina TaxID=140057 RepID=UPI0016126941|nr:hypothetical protein [Roseospira marina]MBB4313010.1 hypothetical protein [Roseospira marina]